VGANEPVIERSSVSRARRRSYASAPRAATRRCGAPSGGQEPYVIQSQILSATERIMVVPLVTNAATRDPTVTASVFATLNDTFGNRTICGVGRGDSALRVLGRKPTMLAHLDDIAVCVAATGVRRRAHDGRAGNPDTDFVPDDVIDCFCVLGSVADHIAKLRELESLGVTQFNIYLMHDDMDGTLEAYGHDIIPALHPLAAS